MRSFLRNLCQFRKKMTIVCTDLILQFRKNLTILSLRCGLVGKTSVLLAKVPGSSPTGHSLLVRMGRWTTRAARVSSHEILLQSRHPEGAWERSPRRPRSRHGRTAHQYTRSNLRIARSAAARLSASGGRYQQPTLKKRSSSGSPTLNAHDAEVQ